MFDQNGLWQDDSYLTPGPSGGATGALDLMNVMQSGQNYNQEHQAKMAFLLSKILSDPNAAALLNRPETAEATGMQTPDLWSAYEQTPRGQFTNYAAQNPDASMEDLYQKQVGLGMVPPTSLGAYARTTASDTAKMDRMRMSVEAKYGKQVADTFLGLVKQGFEPQQALDMAQTTGTGTLAGSGATTQAPAVTATIENKNAQTGYIKGPKTALTNAQTSFVLTRNNWYPAIADAQIQSLISSAGHKDALTAATELNSSIKSQQAEGAMTPQARVDLQSKATRTADALRRMQADADVQAEVKKGTPQGMAYQKTMQAMTLGIQQATKLAQTAPTIKLAKPKQQEQATAQPHPTFKTLDAFRAAFRADQKRDPSDKEIARAQQGGWIVP